MFGLDLLIITVIVLITGGSGAAIWRYRAVKRHEVQQKLLVAHKNADEVISQAVIDLSDVDGDCRYIVLEDKRAESALTKYRQHWQASLDQAQQMLVTMREGVQRGKQTWDDWRAQSALENLRTAKAKYQEELQVIKLLPEATPSTVKQARSHLDATRAKVSVLQPQPLALAGELAALEVLMAGAEVALAESDYYRAREMSQEVVTGLGKIDTIFSQQLKLVSDCAALGENILTAQNEYARMLVEIGSIQGETSSSHVSDAAWLDIAAKQLMETVTPDNLERLRELCHRFTERKTTLYNQFHVTQAALTTERERFATGISDEIRSLYLRAEKLVQAVQEKHKTCPSCGCKGDYCWNNWGHKLILTSSDLKLGYTEPLHQIGILLKSAASSELAKPLLDSLIEKCQHELVRQGKAYK